MKNDLKIYLANFADKDVLVEIGDDTYLVAGRDCPYIFRESQKEPITVRIGFQTDSKALNKKDFNFELDGVIRFCEHEGGLRFCDIENLSPTPTLKLVD